MLSLLARPSRNADVSWRPLDARWYSAIGAASDAGPTIVPEKALGIAVVYRALNVLAHAIASIPLVVYERLPDRGKERAVNHPAYDLLHDRPNAWMTSFRWRHLMAVQRVLYGNHYSEILPGRGGIGQLVPLSPATTRPVDQLSDGRLLYVTRNVTARGYGPERRLLQDEVLHVRGFSMDGKVGLPLPQLAKNAMGLALMAERHGSMFLKKGARFAGVLTAEGTGRMDSEVREANEAAWQRAYGGADATGGTPILSGGMKYTPISSNNKDSQWLESRTFQVEELLRFLGVPGVLCGYADKTSTYASAEQFFLSFVTHTIRPETTQIAQELNLSVVTESPKFFADFVLEDLLRGDIKTRYSAHQLAIQTGWKTRNEARVEENMNKGPAELDEFVQPMNFEVVGEETDPAPPPAPRTEDDDEDEEEEESERGARLEAIAHRAVEKLVRKELSAIAGGPGRMGAARRFADNPAGWTSFLTQFYDGHAVAVADNLGVVASAATRYCDAQRTRLARGIPEQFEAQSIGAMLALLED